MIAGRYHDFCMGHKVTNHEGKCRNLHGHNYRIYLNCEAKNLSLDELGRVIDFSVIKSTLCEWIEQNWDHRFMIWESDPMQEQIIEMDDAAFTVAFNPTAENIIEYFVETIAPKVLEGTGVKLIRATLEETRKCYVEYNART